MHADPWRAAHAGREPRRRHVAGRHQDQAPHARLIRPGVVYVDELIDRYLAAQEAQRHHPVILTGLFVLDLLTIHPFVDGNGRITRAVSNALPQDAGYDVTRDVSWETPIARSSDAYDAALLASTARWHEARHDPRPWLRYLVGLVARSYDSFTVLTTATRSGGNKHDRVRDDVLRHAPATSHIADVRSALPGVSDPTIRLGLNQLRDAGLVDVDSVGRTATWTRSSRRGDEPSRSAGPTSSGHAPLSDPHTSHAHRAPSARCR